MSRQESLLSSGYEGYNMEHEASSSTSTRQPSTSFSSSTLSVWWADAVKRRYLLGGAIGLTVLLLLIIIIAVATRSSSGGGGGGGGDTPPPLTACTDPARSAPFGVCGLENCGTACPTTPTLDTSSLSTWPITTYLPNPFLSMDGCLTTTAAQWTCRRAEISSHIQQLELGIKPPRPAVVSGSVEPGSANNGTIRITAGNGTFSVSFDATYLLPTNGASPPYPAMIGVGGVNLNTVALRAQGVAIITFPQDDVAQQSGQVSRGRGKFFQLYGADYSAGALIAWAWGVSRMIDVLEMQTSMLFDPKRLGVTGCSRNGKGALVVGAFDERIALTIPQESGSGGTASWRISDWQGTQVQTLGQITDENVWFQDAFKLFKTAATKLPYDHHALQGMVAPRGLLVVDNSDQVRITPPTLNTHCTCTGSAGSSPPPCLTCLLSVCSGCCRCGWAT